jgi:hypothetical protein
MRMRSAGELYFRLRQESANLRLYVAPPSLAPMAHVSLLLPDPQPVAESLRGSPYARQIEILAGQIAAGQLPILGFTIPFDGHWRRDPVHGIESAPEYFRRIPYLDAAAAGDHKVIWEFNRHQHWVVLAQDCLLNGRTDFLKTIEAEFEAWVAQNPYLRGINWTSALEVAFRTMSWIWVYHLVGDRMSDAWRARFLEQLYRHGRYLEHNLSVYFSPNTHLLGEAVALHALGLLFPMFPRSARWRQQGGDWVERALIAQVREDGSHFEQSSYYHVYTLDMALTWFLLEGRPAGFRAKIERMAEYLHALMGPARRLPFLGDDDGGRWFHPYGPRDEFGRATLATCSVLFDRAEWLDRSDDLAEQAAWWLGVCAATPRQGATSVSHLFADAGVAVLRTGDFQAIAKAGPLGAGSGGHSHADALSIVIRNGNEEILIDPGTFTYVGDPEERTWFRQTAAHSTVCVDGAGQATTSGPFRWIDPAEVEILKWTSTTEHDFLDAACRYRGLTHRRRFLLLRAINLLLVADDVTGDIAGPAGSHRIEQFWHLGIAPVPLGEQGWRIGTRTVLTIAPGSEVELEKSWRSPAFGVKEEAPVLRVHRQCEFPVRLAAAIDFSGRAGPCSLSADRELVFHTADFRVTADLQGGEPKYSIEKNPLKVPGDPLPRVS